MSTKVAVLGYKMRYLFPTKTSIIEIAKRGLRNVIFCFRLRRKMEQFILLNSIPDGDAQQLLSDTISKAASSAALAAVRSVLSDEKP